MLRQINFLAERHKTVAKQQLIDQHALRYALVMFGVVFSVFALIFAIRLFSEIQLRQIAQAQETALAKIGQGEETERLYLIFFQKVKVLSTLFGERQNKQGAISYMSTVFQPFGMVTEINFNQQEQVLTFQISSTDVFKLQKVFDVLNQDQFTQRFRSVNASNLQRTEDGKYVVQVTISTKGAGENLAITPDQGLQQFPTGGTP